MKSNHHEVTLMQLSSDFYTVSRGDRASDDDDHDETLKQDRANLIALHRSIRNLTTEDGRYL